MKDFGHSVLMVMGMLIIFGMISFAITQTGYRKDRIDPCIAPPGLIQRCIDSPDCTINPHQLLRHEEYEEMLSNICPD